MTAFIVALGVVIFCIRIKGDGEVLGCSSLLPQTYDAGAWGDASQGFARCLYISKRI
jgi:hypothetical protein